MTIYINGVCNICSTSQIFSTYVNTLLSLPLLGGYRAVVSGGNALFLGSSFVTWIQSELVLK